jgi:hypothetical protein
MKERRGVLAEFYYLVKSFVFLHQAATILTIKKESRTLRPVSYSVAVP